MKDRYSYIAIFTYDEDGIVIEFPDLPGCCPCADKDDTDTALKNAKEAGLDGIVCSPLEAGMVKEAVGKDFFLMLTGANAHYYFFKRQQALLEFKGNAATDTKSTYVAYDRKRKETIQPTFVNDDYPSLDITLDKLMQCAGGANRCFFLMEAFNCSKSTTPSASTSR